MIGDFSDSGSEFSFISASQQGSENSFISSGTPTSGDRCSFTYDLPDSARTSRMSTSSEQSIGSHRLGIKFTDLSFLNNSSTASEESGRTSCSYSSQSLDDVEAQMRRLRLELKQTMDMYSSACKEALTARQEVFIIHMALNFFRQLHPIRNNFFFKSDLYDSNQFKLLSKSI